MAPYETGGLFRMIHVALFGMIHPNIVNYPGYTTQYIPNALYCSKLNANQQSPIGLELI